MAMVWHFLCSHCDCWSTSVNCPGCIRNIAPLLHAPLVHPTCRRLKQKQMIEAAMTKHGLKSASKAKRMRMLEAAEEEAEALADLRSRMLAGSSEHKVDPAQLEGACANTACACTH